MTKKLTTEDFIRKAQAVHGDRYNYSLSVYNGSKEKVLILCKSHGEFWQSPANHMHGFGCLQCGLANAGQYHKKDTEQFVSEARTRHGSRYDYSKVVYKGARESLIFICPFHGEFSQSAYVHLRSEPGQACLACSYDHRGRQAAMSAEEFISKAQAMHNSAYDYSRVLGNYQNSLTKIEIICHLHGSFLQTPGNHLSGKGCKKCSTEKIAKALVKSADEFIKDARSIHGQKYDYSQTNYLGAFNLVKITCPVDGTFEQSPTSHLGGIGCPKCSRRNQGAPRNLTRALRGEFDDDKEAYVYQVQFRLEGVQHLLYKVGSGTGSRKSSVLNSIRKIGGQDLDIKIFNFSSTGEAIVFEHLAHSQIEATKFVFPNETKFPGYSEVFTSAPDFLAIESHPTLQLFRHGERWQSSSSSAD